MHRVLRYAGGLQSDVFFSLPELKVNSIGSLCRQAMARVNFSLRDLAVIFGQRLSCDLRNFHASNGKF